MYFNGVHSSTRFNEVQGSSRIRYSQHMPISLVQQMNRYLVEAEKGNAHAMYMVGMINHEMIGRFRNPQDIKVSKAERFKWFKYAAESGHVLAMVKLGEIYNNRLKYSGLDRQYWREAKRWLVEASRAGNEDAMALMGDLYKREFKIWKSGKGHEDDLPNAIKWYMLAARKGNEAAARDAEELQALVKKEPLNEIKEQVSKSDRIETPEEFMERYLTEDISDIVSRFLHPYITGRISQMAEADSPRVPLIVKLAEELKNLRYEEDECANAEKIAVKAYIDEAVRGMHVHINNSYHLRGCPFIEIEVLKDKDLVANDNDYFSDDFLELTSALEEALKIDFPNYPLSNDELQEAIEKSLEDFKKARRKSVVEAKNYTVSGNKVDQHLKAIRLNELFLTSRILFFADEPPRKQFKNVLEAIKQVGCREFSSIKDR